MTTGATGMDRAGDVTIAITQESPTECQNRPLSFRS